MLGFVVSANAQATTTAVGVAPSMVVTYGTVQTFTATVSAGTSAVTAGFVTFTDTTTNTVLAAAVALNGSGQAATNAVLRAAAHNLQATYTPDVAHTGSVGATGVTVNKATLNVKAQDTEIPYSVNPQLLSFYSGFVNGDSVLTAVSGAPALTTNATLRNGVPNAGTW